MRAYLDIRYLEDMTSKPTVAEGITTGWLETFSERGAERYVGSTKRDTEDQVCRVPVNTTCKIYHYGKPAIQ